MVIVIQYNVVKHAYVVSMERSNASYKKKHLFQAQ